MTDRAHTWRPILPAEIPYLEALGAGLKSLRKKAGLTQAQLAEAALMSACSVKRIEAGTRRTRTSTLTRIVNALNAESKGVADLAALVATAGPALGREAVNTMAHERKHERRRRRQANRRKQEAKKITRSASAAVRDLAG